MKRLRLIRSQLNLLLLAVALPLALLLAYTIYEDLKHDQQQAGEAVSMLAVSLADDVAAVLADARELLKRLALRRARRLLDRERCDPLLEDLLRLDPRFFAVITADRNGRVACERHSSDGAVQVRRVQSDRSFMSGVAEPGGLATVIEASGVRRAVQSQALQDGEGKVVGVLSVIIDVERYAHALDLSRFPPGTTAEIRDASGAVVFRAPRASGGEARRDDVLGRVMGQTNGRATVVAGDGIERLYAHAAIRGTDWHVVAGVPTEAILAPTRELAIRNSVLAFVIIGGVGFMAWVLARRISRPIRRLAQAAQTVAAGALDTRVEASGPAEIAEVARQFNVMVDARRQAERLLRDARIGLENLSRRLLDVQEAERGRIARELHDEIGQALTALCLRLQAQQVGTPCCAGLLECIGIAEGALRQVRNLCLDLRPPQLDDLGLAAALRWQIDRQAQAAGIAAQVTITGMDREPAAEIATVCFRIAQEAMTNVVRHAEAGRVWVELDRDDDWLNLAVRDDGRGFDVAAARRDALRGGSMGLLSMEERVALAGGSFELDSRPGEGTQVRARLPMGAVANATKEAS